jgi:beta-glucanase (GH16 family)
MASNVKDCDCGFIDSKDPTQTTFTSLLVIDFTTITQKQLDDLFVTATFEVDQSDAPYVRSFSADQVALSDAGLGLTVSPPDGRSVPCAGIFTKETSFLHGSYRARFLAGGASGTVTAFYNYKNDTSEVDIEYLSAWETPTLLYTVKPQKYLANGNPDNSTYQRHPWTDTPASFDRDFQEWSFVWLPDVVHYGLNGDYSDSLVTNVPQAPGRIALNHWSNGDPRYSIGPPTENSTHTVSFLQAVYNDANATALACKHQTSACVIADGLVQSASGGSPTASGGASNPTLSAVTHLNSAAHGVHPMIPGWLLLLVWCLWC